MYDVYYRGPVRGIRPSPRITGSGPSLTPLMGLRGPAFMHPATQMVSQAENSLDENIPEKPKPKPIEIRKEFPETWLFDSFEMEIK
jgi:hypothetical protein